MVRSFPFLGLILPAILAVLILPALAASGLEGSSWTLAVTEQCQLGQIGKILLQPDGTAQATAQVETSTGNAASGGASSGSESQSTDLQGTWTYSDNALHLSFNDGSLTLDGPVKDGKFVAKAAMKTDMGDPLQQDCLLKRN